MNFEAINYVGVLVGAGTFLIIGIFHPIVTKTEYHLGKKMWPLFVIVGAVFCAASLFIENPIVCPLLAVIGFSSFWSIKELFEQEERVKKGWFPANPKRALSEADHTDKSEDSKD
jgi:hypothetical protein